MGDGPITARSVASNAAADGAKDVAPILIGVIPFGLITGVAAGASVLGDGLGWATSFIIFAGAAQLATIELFDAGAVTAVIIATALVINSRHMMYSAALAPSFGAFPALWRFGLPYLLTDQAFAVSLLRFQDVTDPTYRRWYYLGGAITLWISWQVTTAAGVVFGAVIPDAWNLGFAIPLVFLALLIPAVTSRPGLVAATVGAGIAIAAAGAPYTTGLIIGAVAGIAAGMIAGRWWP